MDVAEAGPLQLVLHRSLGVKGDVHEVGHTVRCPVLHERDEGLLPLHSRVIVGAVIVQQDSDYES